MQPFDKRCTDDPKDKINDPKRLLIKDSQILLILLLALVL